MDGDSNKVIAAIAGITILETTAILTGLDGAMFGLCVISIAGLGGFIIGTLNEKWRQVKV